MSGEMIGLEERPKDLTVEQSMEAAEKWIESTKGNPKQRLKDLESHESIKDAFIDCYLGIR